MTSTDAIPTEHSTRRRPAQARSRQRFDDILEAASSLIAERGLGPISMTEIAEAAQMRLPAVYRYFPNKASIIRELANRQLEEAASLNGELSSSGNVSIEDQIRANVKAYCQFLDDPVRLQIRAAIHSDAELSQIDLEDSRRNAAIIAAAVDHDGLGIGRLELERRALLLVELFDGVVRLASRLDAADADTVIDTFAEMAVWTLLNPTPFRKTT